MNADVARAIGWERCESGICAISRPHWFPQKDSYAERYDYTADDLLAWCAEHACPDCFHAHYSRNHETGAWSAEVWDCCHPTDDEPECAAPTMLEALEKFVLAVATPADTPGVA